MEKVISKDGTPIAYWKSGKGPPLLLVHGGADHTRWDPLLPVLNDHFTVYAMDRRGRGASGDSPEYHMEREFEDVAVVVDAIGEPVNLLGHSFGGTCALEAALLTPNVRKLVNYEGVAPAGFAIFPPGSIARLEELLQKGDRDAVVTSFLQEIVRMPLHELELMRSLPTWQGRVASAHTLLREIRNLETYDFRPERFRHLRTPTLLLLGGESPDFFKAATKMMAEALPDCWVAVLPGQKHIAMNTTPQLFLDEVLKFLM